MLREDLVYSPLWCQAFGVTKGKEGLSVTHWFAVGVMWCVADINELTPSGAEWMDDVTVR